MFVQVREVAKAVVKRVAARAAVRRMAARVFRDEFSLASDLESVPLERLLQHHYEVWRHLHDRINHASPNFKLQSGGVCSFFDFVATHIRKDRPIRVLDIAAGDCYLDFMLAQRTHRESRFECIDIKRASPLYAGPRVSFTETDVFSILADIEFTEYDYVVLSGFLGLLRDDQASIVLSAVRQCPLLFVRENPRITNLIDAWNSGTPGDYGEYPNLFTERSLKDTLASHGFDILALEHEYDIYVFAASPQTAAHTVNVASFRAGS